MHFRTTDFDRSFDVLDELRRQMDRVWGDLDERWGYAPRAAAQALPATSFPRVNVYDAGASLVVVADVPGVDEKDLQLTFDDGVLLLAGKRRADAPKGYAPLRQERAADVEFRRTLALPAKVDVEKTTAELREGVLTITLAKTPESKPRQIAVRTAG